MLLLPAVLLSMTGTRFGIGFFLAGIYPVGMKIASGWYQKGLGGALGFLVGALVLGTALPHALRGLRHRLALAGSDPGAVGAGGRGRAADVVPGA